MDILRVLLFLTVITKNVRKFTLNEGKSKTFN